MKYPSSPMTYKALSAAFFLITVSASTLPLSANTVSHHNASQKQTVTLKAMPDSPLDQVARSLNQDIIDDSSRHHDTPLFLIGSAPLSLHKGDEGLFVQIQSPRLCGSSGCTTSVYLHRGTEWVNVIDAVNGDITVLHTRHKGMYDLLIDNNDKWIWNGHTYQDTMPE